MSKLITKEEAGEISAWELPDVATFAGGGRNLLTAKQIEAIQKQAYEEGFALGRKEGRNAGQAQIKASVQRLEQLMSALARPFAELDQRVEKELVNLAIAMTRQLIRRELKTDPGQIIAVVREALAALPVATRGVRVHLHPDDAALVRSALSVAEGEQAWKLMEDPALTRGGCRVVSETSQIDATVEARLNAIIAATLGGERGSDA